MTLRESFKGKSTNPNMSAAVLLMAYEYGDKGFNINDPVVNRRIDSLANLTDEQFRKEHERVMFELDEESLPSEQKKGEG